MKIINNIIAIAIIAIFAVACTNEEDFNSSSSKNSINQKSLNGDYRKFASYEEIYCSDSILQLNLDVFNKAINDEGPMPSFDIKMALLVMETHFNYGIVVKLHRLKDPIEYDNMNFTFTVPITDAQINGSEIKTAYKTFVYNVMAAMSGKNLELSDIYVENITSTSVTFGLDMGSSTKNIYSDEIYPAVSVLKNVGDPIFILPSSTTSVWSNLPNEAYESNVYRNSFKRLNVPTGQGMIPIYTNQTNYGGAGVYTYTTENPGDPVIWNANDLATILIPEALRTAHASLNSHYGPLGYVMYGYSVRVKQYLNVDIDNNPYNNNNVDKYHLYIERIKCAKIRQISIYDLFMSTYTTRGFEI